MNQVSKYVEHALNIKNNNVNNLCIALLPLSAGDGCKYSRFFPAGAQHIGKTDLHDTLYTVEREEWTEYNKVLGMWKTAALGRCYRE
jgi:hypothetical protein